MTQKRYHLFFAGKTVEGFAKADVKQNLSELFGGDEEKVGQFFSDKPVLIKKNLDQFTARKYVNMLRKAGAVCHVKAVEVPAGIKSPPEEKKSDPASKGFTACPKCGYEQTPSSECVACGIVFSKFLEKSVEDFGEAPETDVVVYAESADPDPVDRNIRRKNITVIVLAVGIVLLVASFLQKDKLPAKKEIVKKLYKQPLQTQTDARPFDTTVGGRTYHITPLFDYELYGLVVSYYDSTGWWDITHKFLWKDYINIKDICVLYGYNVITEAYKGMSFKSGSWTCWAKTKTDEARRKFFAPCLSNNHLISDNKRIKKTIMSAEKGDQIYLKGYLATYSQPGGGLRGTSITRTDTGNGACETIYVEEFEILKKANRPWRFLFTLSTLLVAAGIILMIIFFVQELKSGSHESFITADKQVVVKVIFQLLLLLLLLYLWARLH